MSSSRKNSLEGIKIPEGSDYQRFGLRRNSSGMIMEETISPSSQGTKTTSVLFLS